MNVVIVEDERPAAARLRRALSQYDPKIDVVAHLQTVSETIAWMDRHAAPDLFFLDIRLTDGLSLDIFRSRDVSCPVVFTTAYDAYVLDAFECNSIDYILKPVKAERLAQALRKYDQLRRHYNGRLAESVRQAIEQPRPTYRKRLLAQRGQARVSLDARDLRYGVSEGKMTFLVDRNGTRYLSDAALATLEAELNPSDFFRINRQYIVHIDAVSSFRSASRGRLAVDLRPASDDEVLISQARAGLFKKWIDR